ncbi:MAG: methyltransferase domain-containing protein [Candidatus Diapherotrites archaeon]|uniref:Methyltransferase domain-containing protein n=1 Tax=Candidatus Iainarchaeum sp. TaxID=3101447 RepID=A0A8T4L0Z5_9ARCH|nr:methyltransferase domain-containing protein [Candidatus Diapherotrites archaeon]
MANQFGFLANMLVNPRMRQDVLLLGLAEKAYGYYAFELCKKTGIVQMLSLGPRHFNEISKDLELKHTEMLESMLGFLVSQGIIVFSDGLYSLSEKKPHSLSLDEEHFIHSQYQGAEDWTLLLYHSAENALRFGRDAPQNKSALDYLRMMDSLAFGPLFSFRDFAIKKLMVGLPDHPKIANLGCGTGLDMMDIFESSSGSMHLVAVDSEKDLLDLAKDRLKLVHLGDKHIDFISLDLLETIELPQDFDAVFSGMYLNRIPKNKRDKFIQNLARNIDERGKLVSFHLVNSSPLNRVFVEWLTFVMPNQYGFPVFGEYKLLLEKYFSKVEFFYDGMVTVAYK